MPEVSPQSMSVVGMLSEQGAVGEGRASAFEARM